jgi:hypothetical protein
MKRKVKEPLPEMPKKQREEIDAVIGAITVKLSVAQSYMGTNDAKAAVHKLCEIYELLGNTWL